jgi:hypothetical protein
MGLSTRGFEFVAGGTVQASGGVYLEREADHELLEHCRAGDFTYILTSRQMGKSSLMIRTAERLDSEGARPVIIDLSGFGAQITAEQWYKGFLFTVQDQLDLRTPAGEWWDGQSEHAFAHRFTRYLREVALVQRRDERLVVFVDEIDTTLRLDFTDDFFAAIRFLYQSRAADEELRRLSFVLVGVATPGDLIKDATRTPFNIGHRIELTDFTLEESLALVHHLPVPPAAGRDLLGWILRWTGGHPYLTMRAVRSLAECPAQEWTRAAIDDRIRALFFGAKGESDSNLQFVRDMLTKKAFDREAVLRTYHEITRGRQVPDKDLDQVASWLKLSGVVARQDGMLRVRNAVYEEVFDERWAHEHLRLNVNWRRRLAQLAGVLLGLIVAVTIPLAMFAQLQKTQAEQERQQAELQRDEAQRQRKAAERSLTERTAALETAQKPIDELKRYDPKSAAVLSTQVAGELEVARKNLANLTESLRDERDDALRRLKARDADYRKLVEQNGDLTERLRRSTVAAPPPLQGLSIVPSIAGRDLSSARDTLSKAGLTAGVVPRQASGKSGIVLEQSPAPGVRMTTGASVSLAVSAPAAIEPPPSKWVWESTFLETGQSVSLQLPPFSGRVAITAGKVAASGTRMTVTLRPNGSTLVRGNLASGRVLNFTFEGRKYTLTLRRLRSDDPPFVVFDIVAQ